MSVDLGFGGVLNNAQAEFLRKLKEEINELKSEIIIARVTDVVLDAGHDKFSDVGEYNGIGTIFWSTVDFTTSQDNTARPFHGNYTSPPLINELVLLFLLPNTDIGQDSTKKSYYYSNIISLWNSPHCNPYPNTILSSPNPPSNNKTIDQTLSGSPNKVSTTTPDIKLNTSNNQKFETFQEKNDIQPLQPYPGDVIYEGRWGNSLRFSSTANPANIGGVLTEGMQWSKVGDNGDPIVIIRNGQNKNIQSEDFAPITEDINEDQSLIYLTSTQQIPIETINNEFTSYESAPDMPNEYEGAPQVIINSGRLVFNAKTDHVLISGEKSVFLGGNNSVNINAGNNIVIESSDIKLGNSNASESLILGDKFLDTFDSLLESISQLCTQLQVEQNWPAGVAVPKVNVLTAAASLQGLTNKMKTMIPSFKSKNTKTI